MNIDSNVRAAATKLQDHKLLSKLSAGDMHAIDAYYHASCLTALYNRARSIRPPEQDHNERSEISLENIALAELVIFIEDSPRPAVFQLSNLSKMYSCLLEELGARGPQRVNSTRLKERLLAQLPGLRAYTEGKEVKLTFSDDIGAALQLAETHNYDTEAMHLAKAAMLVRREMFSNKQQFTGTFEPDCQRAAVPDLLLALISMILEGTNVKDRIEAERATHANFAATISQLLFFNAVKRQRENRVDATATRHDPNREPPLPVYLGLVIHAETRKKTLVDKLYRLGLSISYDRVMQISADLGNNVCAQFEDEGVVCPSKLKRSLFITGSVDNIDHNTSSRTAKDSFHGTAISLTQHPTNSFTGIDRARTVIHDDIPKKKTLSELPESYTSIEPYTEHGQKKDYYVTEGGEVNKPRSDLVDESMKSEYQWLSKVEELLEREKLEEREYLSWSAYFASNQTGTLPPPAITSLLPLFEENAHSKAMIQHAMKLVKNATLYLNPGQLPVIGMDQPLYALAKQIQWDKPDEYGEGSYLAMMGGLHIEMASLKMIGNWLTNSGWDAALVQADITTSGRADAILKAAHITRARYAHQVSACALHVLQKKAYQASVEDSDEPEDFTKWAEEQREAHPQFLYWSTTLELELLVLEFVRSVREGNFALYIQVLGKLCPWMFVLDLVNYSRWLPVHVKDMVSLKERHPALYAEFLRGKFTVQKSQRLFSKKALDHNHEQENELIKGEGGAVGLTESPTALRRWMVSGPEIARVVKEFESSYDAHKPDSDTRHHEQVPSVQKNFAKDVKALVGVIEEMGNPFSEESHDLLVLDTKEIMPTSVVEAISSAKAKGESLYNTYVEERLTKRSKPITDTITRCDLTLFGMSEKKKSSKASNQINDLKSNCNLFARLYIACQAREGNLEDFFKHENSSKPPALSCNGKMRSGQKSDLIPCIEVKTTAQRPQVDASVLDAAAVVNMLSPGKCKHFKEYADTVFLPYIATQAQHVRRIDLVWDRYLPNSLKQGTRENRGTGARRRVCDSAPIPVNWKAFLRVDENKTQLFQYLAECAAATHLPAVEVISTTAMDVISSPVSVSTEGLAPCNHEEADTRIFVHVKHAAARGFKKVLIRTVDTDVVVLAVAFAHKLQLNELWIAFGVGKYLRYLPIHDITRSLTPQQCEGLPFLHAVTGCDTVSFFGGKGKKTAYQVYKCCPEAAEVFRTLSAPQDAVSEEQFNVLERFVILMYSRTSAYTDVNSARQAMFAQGSRSIDNIPPTQAALEQHVKRAAYQAGHVWGRSLDTIQELPSPTEWGWSASPVGWKPNWTVLPEASKACNQLIKCGCKKACRGACKCTKANLPCTALCTCCGNCYQD